MYKLYVFALCIISTAAIACKPCEVNSAIVEAVIRKCQSGLFNFESDTLLVSPNLSQTPKSLYGKEIKIKWPKSAIIVADVSKAQFYIDTIICDKVSCNNCDPNSAAIRVEFHSNPEMIRTVRLYSGYAILNSKTYEVMDFFMVAPQK